MLLPSVLPLLADYVLAHIHRDLHVMCVVCLIMSLWIPVCLKYRTGNISLIFACKTPPKMNLVLLVYSFRGKGAVVVVIRFQRIYTRRPKSVTFTKSQNNGTHHTWPSIVNDSLSNKPFEFAANSIGNIKTKPFLFYFLYIFTFGSVPFCFACAARFLCSPSKITNFGSQRLRLRQKIREPQNFLFGALAGKTMLKSRKSN